MQRVHIETNTCATARSRGWADPQIFEARTDGLTEVSLYIYPNVSGERGQVLFFRYPRPEEDRELFDSWGVRDGQIRQNRVEKDGPQGTDWTHPHFRPKLFSYPDAPCQIRMSDGTSLGIS